MLPLSRQSFDTPGWLDFHDELAIHFLPNDPLRQIMYVYLRAHQTSQKHVFKQQWAKQTWDYLLKHVHWFNAMHNQSSYFSACHLIKCAELSASTDQQILIDFIF